MANLKYVKDGQVHSLPVRNGVSSINGETGVVQLDGNSINVSDSETTPKIIAEEISSLKANKADKDDVTELDSRVTSLEAKYKTITVTCVTQDGVTVTGQTVYLRNGDSKDAPVEQSKAYNGQPVTFEVPVNYAYFVNVSDTLDGHFNPTTASGVTDTSKSVTLTYSDPENITTFADLQAVIPLSEDNPAMISALIGVEITDTWTATNGTEYSDPMVVASLEYIEDENGVEHWGAFLQRKYASLDSIQFDATENEIATETTAQEGLFYYGQTGDTLEQSALTPLNLSTGAAIPYGDYNKVYRNAIDDRTCYIISNGYNNWRQSAYRQYLNSNAAVGHWWSSQHIGDNAPSQHSTVRGYMAGCSSELLAAAKRCKVSCNTNTKTDSGVIETVVDTFFLPSGTQMYGSVNSGEGTYWEYWKRKTGLTSPDNSENAGRVLYAVNSTSSPQFCRLRSPFCSYSCFAWLVGASGSLGGGGSAYSSYRAAPACAIW